MSESFNLKPNNPKEGKERLKRRILLAEDEEAIRGELVIILNEAGYIVDAVENGQLLLEKLSSENYDLVVTDNHMSIVNGVEALTKIRSDDRFKNLPIIVHSSDWGIEQTVLKLGGVYIDKVFPFGKLPEKIREIFERSDGLT